jgi:hypothetical protein
MTRHPDPGSPTRRGPGPRLAALAFVAALVAAAPPAALAGPAREQAGGKAAATTHEVVSMLRGGIAEEVVLAWLDAAGRPLPLPSAEQLLALKEAGASDGFLDALIERAAHAEPGGEETAPGAEAAPSAAPAPPTPTSAGTAPAPADPTPAEPPSAPAASAPVAPTAAATAGVLVRFRLAHRPRYDDGEEEYDLFVYLDGVPLSYVPADDSLLGSDEPLSFAQRLEPGVHTLRAALERHRAVRGDRWQHDARFSPASLRFELAAGAPAEVRVELREGVLGEGRLDLRFEQEERVEEAEDAGGDPDGWPRLCEEIAADTSRRSARDREWLGRGCVAWDFLWPAGGAPPRDEVRDALARFDYRPVPAGS